MKKGWIPFMLLCIFSLFSCRARAAYKSLGVNEGVQAYLGSKDAVLIDVRRAEEYAEGHIPQAINIPMETIEQDILPVIPEKDRVLFVYCRSGVRSKKAAEKLAAAGYRNVTEIGGILDYTGEIEK